MSPEPEEVKEVIENVLGSYQSDDFPDLERREIREELARQIALEVLRLGGEIEDAKKIKGLFMIAVKACLRNLPFTLDPASNEFRKEIIRSTIMLLRAQEVKVGT